MLSKVLLVLSVPDTDGVDFFFRDDQARHMVFSMQLIPKTVAVIADVFFHIVNSMYHLFTVVPSGFEANQPVEIAL